MIRCKMNKFESRKLTLEERISRLERILYNERNLHRTDELLKGVVGKVNATEKDRDEVIALLKDKLNLNDERSIYIHEGSASPFDFIISFYINDDIENAAKGLKPNIYDMRISVPEYSIKIKDTRKNKIDILLTNKTAVFGYKEFDLEPTYLGYSKDDNEIANIYGLDLFNKEKFVSKVISLLKENGINIADIVSVKDGQNEICDVISRAKNKWFNSVIERLENTQDLKNIEWYNDKNDIIGHFHILNDSKEDTPYKIVYAISDYRSHENNIIYIYNVTTDKYQYRGSGRESNADAIAKDLKKAVNATIMHIEKMRAGWK